MRQDRLMRTIDSLARCTETPGQGVTRPSWSKADRQARHYLETALRALGLEARCDGIGNLRAIKKGWAPGQRIVIGSHLDTVRHGGRLDGAYGVAAALETLTCLHEDGTRHARDIEFIAFAEEEGANFGQTCLGSKAVTGQISPTDIARLRTTDGRDAGSVLTAFGLKLEDLCKQQFLPGEVAAFLEVHIEQNSRLERMGERLGLVEAISAMRLFRVSLTGRSDHAASPMAGRRDPLAAMAEMVGRLESLLEHGTLPEGFCWTVGSVHCQPDAGIIIPGRVEFTLDIRHLVPDILDAAWPTVLSMLDEVADKRKVKMEVTLLSASGGATMAPSVLTVLERAALDLGADSCRVNSGPAHDAAAMSLVAPTGLLFVPSIGGLSHCAEEDTHPDDLGLGAAVLEKAVRALADG